MLAAKSVPRAAQHVLDQFNDRQAQQELRDMASRGFDWVSRTRTTLDTVLPELPRLATRLRDEVPRQMNAPVHVLKKLRAGASRHPELQRGPLGAWYTDICESATASEAVVGHLESQQVSSAIQRFIISASGIGSLVEKNGASIYPDLLLKAHRYDGLPRQTRANPIDGPCLRGDKASNVPDGAEIKTNQGNRIKVDAHGAHPGLHLGVTWDFNDGEVVVTGVWAGYVRIADHRESGRNVSTTTVKYSFGHDLFQSLL